ncbi:hypothetical protein [Moraxella oculi]|nr:hypothetical protein [Moraxella sp. Tifton1]
MSFDKIIQSLPVMQMLPDSRGVVHSAKNDASAVALSFLILYRFL